jgi:hypothetical protein
MLSDDHVHRIRADIERSGITIQELKEDLLDHFCCFVEDELKKGNSFEMAYHRAMEEICPNGFDEIQRETVFLLNSNKIRFMKKVMYSIGLISSMSISIGWLFKILHWPGADELFNYGFLSFVLLFVPLVAIDRYKVNISRALSDKLRIILGFASAILVGVAFVLKFLHLTGADQLLILGALVFIFGFLPFLFFRMYRKSVE